MPRFPGALAKRFCRMPFSRKVTNNGKRVKLLQQDYRITAARFTNTRRYSKVTHTTDSEMQGVFRRHTPSPSFCSGSRIETMVRVSVGPSLTEGLGHSQVTPSQMLAVDGCKVLPFKPSHCFVPTGRRNGTLISYHQLYKWARSLYSIFRNLVTVDHPSQPFLSSLHSYPRLVIS